MEKYDVVNRNGGLFFVFFSCFFLCFFFCFFLFPFLLSFIRLFVCLYFPSGFRACRHVSFFFTIYRLITIVFSPFQSLKMVVHPHLY